MYKLRSFLSSWIFSDTFQENHQSLATDLRIVEESLTMVDDCFNLLEKGKMHFFYRLESLFNLNIVLLYKHQ